MLCPQTTAYWRFAKMDSFASRSLSDLGVRKRNVGRAGTDFNDFDAHVGNMQGESGEIWTALPTLQPNHPKSDRLLACQHTTRAE